MDKKQFLKARWADFDEWVRRDSVRMYATYFLLINIAAFFVVYISTDLAVMIAVAAGMAAREAHELAQDEGFEPPQPRPRLVITGDYRQYQNFLREHNANPKDYMYFNNAGHYMGFHDPEVFLWGEYWKAEEVMRYAHQMGWLR